MITPITIYQTIAVSTNECFPFLIKGHEEIATEMQRRHQLLLSNNHEFLINEIPMDDTLEAIRGKKILTWHDFEQLKTLRHQGRRAIARYFLAVLPHRGSQAFQAFLESLQEANAQHLVDLLLQHGGAVNLEDLLKTDPLDAISSDSKHKRPVQTPTDTPMPPVPDPHEYAVKLTRNARFIRQFVDPAKISPLLAQNKVLTPREADMVLHLNGRHKKWDLIMAALLQRGERAFQAFMAALLQKEYSTVFHSIQETSTEPSGSDNDENFVDNIADNNMESDEEIKQEATKFRKNSLADDLLLQDSAASKNFNTADEILLRRSQDLITLDNNVGQSPVHKSKHDKSLQDSVNKDSRSYDNKNNSTFSDKASDLDEFSKHGQRGISNSSFLNSVREGVEY